MFKRTDPELDKLKLQLKVEKSLDRVRNLAMRMKASDDLLKVVAVLFEEMGKLGFDLYDSNIGILDKKTMDLTYYGSGLGGVDMPTGFVVPFQPGQSPYMDAVYNDLKTRKKFNTFEFSGKALDELKDFIMTKTGFGKAPEEYIEGMLSPVYLVLSYATMKYGVLEVSGTEPLDANKITILKRFAGVLELTYTRFYDLKKVEEQALEAQIEAALEKVRARAMAMHSSDELGDAAVLLYKELQNLGLTGFLNCGYVIVDEKSKIQRAWMTFHDGSFIEQVRLPLTGDSILQKRYESWKRKDPVFHQTAQGRALKKHVEFAAPDLGSKKMEDLTRNLFPDPTIFYCANFSHGYLHLISGTLLSEEEESLLARFTRVFEMTYKRFLDLQKAEAQAREAQIEAALERVRARTMAMYKSEELRELVFEFYKHIQPFGFAKWGFEIKIAKDDKSGFYCWISPPGARVQPEGFNIPTLDHWVLKKYWIAYERQLPIISIEVSGDDKRNLGVLLLENSDMKHLPKEVKANIMETDYVHFSIASMRFGLLKAVDIEPIPEQDISILQRFAKVFEQTYTRFLDLQKVEAQAREALIEAAIEHIRARASGMHKSEEIAEVAATMFQQLTGLGISGLRRCVIYTFNNNRTQLECWYTTEEGKSFANSFAMPLYGSRMIEKLVKIWKSGKPTTIKLSGTPYHDWGKFIRKYGWKYPKGEKPARLMLLNEFPFQHGLIEIATFHDLKVRDYDLAIRFSKVFEQTFTRFLDLQKAEAQAREAQIEAALERVRARTMAMHKSDELREVVFEFFEQLHPLGFAKWGFQLRIAREDKNGFNIWISTPAERILPDQYHIPTLDHWVLRKYWEVYEQQLDQVTIEVTGEDKLKLDLLLFEKSDVKNFSAEVKKSILAYDYVQFSVASMRYGLLEAIDVEPIPSEKFEILQRFAKVFEQTYTRFLDLKKAEVQAREAQIEAALERVRARTMAMQKSSELSDAATVLFKQIRKLGGNLWSSGFVLLDDEKEGEFWMSNPEGNIQPPIFIPNTDDPATKNMYEQWKKGVEFYSEEAGGDALKSHYEYLMSLPKAGHVLQIILDAGFSLPTWQQWNVAYFSHGYLLIITLEPVMDIDLFKRFARTFEQTYTRFLDLKQVEAREREAIKQSSLDRVRAEIASMRTTDDLNRIIPIIWKELTTLGVPFFRCGVFIVDDENEKINVYLSTPSGESLAAWHSNYDSLPLFRATVDHWKKQKVYREEWDKKQFIKFTKSLINQGMINSPTRYQAGKDAPEYLSLQMIPFEQGMLYVGSAEKLDEEQVTMVKALADAFSVAYARYEDFRQLEEAKNQIEMTLDELKSTQSQLIHAEKMASLGELTAGIAHEIQNPLNFVNNFSEVSVDLIEDMEDGVINGNMEEVKAITEDIRQNLDKINYHGKRASDIVKGMLQHSRSSSGRKEPADLNLLADEYLRLAYHGLRAKDKSFNAEFRTILDSSLPEVNVITQEIGRVLLNLINNAFYAVSEAQKNWTKATAVSKRTDPSSPKVSKVDGRKEDNDYNPLVTVSTKKLQEKVEIRIIDNGNGIPESIVDKIFQPFFTTKPTGQGTGLGLSLSYDIITKGHHGTLEVVTKEGIGTEFIIVLPDN